MCLRGVKSQKWISGQVISPWTPLRNGVWWREFTAYGKWGQDFLGRGDLCLWRIPSVIPQCCTKCLVRLTHPSIAHSSLPSWPGVTRDGGVIRPTLWAVFRFIIKLSGSIDRQPINNRLPIDRLFMFYFDSSHTATLTHARTHTCTHTHSDSGTSSSHHLKVETELLIVTDPCW